MAVYPPLWHNLSHTSRPDKAHEIHGHCSDFKAGNFTQSQLWRVSSTLGQYRWRMFMFFLVALLTSSFRGMFDGFQIKMCDRFDRCFHVKRTNLQPKSRLGMSWHGERALHIPYSIHVSACLGWICWEVTEASRPKMARQLHAEDAAFWRTCKVGCWLTVIVRGAVHTIIRKDMGSLS